MLLFDAGNSRCKWVWMEKGKLLRQGILANDDPQCWQTLKQTFTHYQPPQKILVSNVAGDAVKKRLQALCDRWILPVEIISARSVQCGVHNAYENPGQLGSDRWASLIAAWSRVRQACLVVNCGTAITVDTLSATGEFIGGLIMPGIALMQHSLLDNTKLAGKNNLGPEFQGEVCDYPRNTADAMMSGIVRASVGAIRHQYDLLASEGPPHAIVSGGGAMTVIPNLGFSCDYVENLVLEGLHIIGQHG